MSLKTVLRRPARPVPNVVITPAMRAAALERLLVKAQRAIDAAGWAGDEAWLKRAQAVYEWAAMRLAELNASDLTMAETKEIHV